MRQIADRRWVALIERVCEERLITPAFQPIVDCARGVVCGYEGLTRFADSPDGGSPEDWFYAAALHGCTGRLEAAAIDTVLSRRSELPDNCFLSVNLSPDAVLASEVNDVLDDAGDLSGVVVEITEQTPVEDYDALTSVLDALRGRGLAIAVDDVGAGYASLTHLLALRPDFVKLDRKLVSGVDRDPRVAAAVAAIGAFASELDAWLVAEGIEHERELERLIDLRVPLVQGYLLGRPAPAMGDLPDNLVALMRRRRALHADGRLAALATPALTVTVEPLLVAETTVLIDAAGRPQRVIVPAGGRRISRHPAMCVQPDDDVADVALRAVARRSEDRHGPICLCDDSGRLVGLISIDAVLETLARAARSTRG